MVTMITGMAIGVVASAITQSIMNSFGKQTEAQYVDFATKGAIGITALGVFAKLIKSLVSLG
jgi:ABC-type lipoprotein release transport system permease subunit